MIAKLPDIKSRAKVISEGKDQEAPCPHSTKDILAMTIPANFVENMKTEAAKCWTYYSKVARGAICGMCDSDVAKFMNLSKNSILIDEAQVSGLATNCGGYAKLLADNVYPWFEDIEVLSRCEINGKISLTKPTITMPFTQSDWNGVSTCIASSGKGAVCNKMAEQGFKLGTESPWFHGDLSYLATVWSNFL